MNQQGFSWQQLLSTTRISMFDKNKDNAEMANEKEAEFFSDHKRIITSPAFRRLQDKTQVFPLERNDFIRTRLTHSLEVSVIASQIVNHIAKNRYIHKNDSNFIQFKQAITKVLECASLIHDIGNPPFGHFGEEIIQQWFKKTFPPHQDKEKNTQLLWPEKVDYNKFSQQYLQDFYQFEGNAQALRIITKLNENLGNSGLNLTFAVLNTIIKYTRCSTQIADEKIVNKKLGYFQSEADIFAQITTSTGTGKARHPLTYLLEAADDIAYLTADIEDAIKKKLVSLDFFKHCFIEHLRSLENNYSNEQQKNTFHRFIKIVENTKGSLLNEIRNYLISGSAYVFSLNYNDIMNGRYDGDLFSDNEQVYQSAVKFLRKFCIQYIFNDKNILKLEIAGYETLTYLLDKFILAVLPYSDLNQVNNKLHKKIIMLISERYKEIYRDTIKNITSEEEKLYYRLLMVTDFISGMTDSYAQNLYQELSGRKI